MRILVTGGAGYIGSHVVLALREAGHSIVVVDDLSAGRREAVPAEVVFVAGDCGDGPVTSDVIARHAIEAVMHFAGSIVVPESFARPLDYYHNNTCASRSLLASCVANGVRHIVFSSTAAVYGSPARVPVTEDMPTVPINPYGASKLMTEWILKDAAAAHGLSYAALRYFNVAGADPQGRAGQSSAVATHLVKVACEAAVGQRDHVKLFGDDYDTPDGTCIRDYIHVSDLADAHVRALQYLAAGGASVVLNCGYGHAHSVREVLSTVQRRAGKSFDVRPAPRRPGDPGILIADPAKLRRTLQWTPRFDDLDVIVQTAL